MKYFSCSAFSLLAIVLASIGIIAVTPAQAQLTWSKSEQNAPASVIQSVEVAPENNEVTVKISSSRPITPQISLVDGPPRLVIDLPHTLMPLHQKRFNVHSEQIKAVRIDQYNNAPPTARAVVDLLAPVSYTWENSGNELIIHLRSAESDKPASIPSITQGIQAAAVPVTQASPGAVMLDVSRIAAGSWVTAGSDTAVVRLSRGGEVRVCPGTAVSVTPSQDGHDLMLAMNTGAMEAHYTLQASADSVLTPDFRMMLAGPGDFNFAISSDAHGNTCVRSLPGNTASIIVSELMGDGTYQVRPNEQVVFRAGSLAVRDADVPASCGCPSPRSATMMATDNVPYFRTEEKTKTVNLAQPEIAKGSPAANTNSEAVRPTTQSAPAVVSAGTSALPANKPNDVQVEVDAPFVFRASDLPPSDSAPAGSIQANSPGSNQPGSNQPGSNQGKTMASSMATQPATIALPAASRETPPKPSHHGFMRKIKGFFSAIFH